jgi:hypothetical protein
MQMSALSDGHPDANPDSLQIAKSDKPEKSEPTLEEVLALEAT